MELKTNDRIRDLFLQAVDLTQSGREMLLRGTADDDPEVLQTVRQLLRNADAERNNPIETPPPNGNGRVHTGNGGTSCEANPLIGLRIGNFQLTGLLGVGGMGKVFRARQDRTGQEAALKLIHFGLFSEELHRRFELEAKILGRLQHPGIAKIFSADTANLGAGPQPYLAMELVDGVPLTTFANQRQLSIRHRLELFVLAVDAVQHAHQKGIIHRDLKPGNILVTPDGRPKVLDFGVARLTGDGEGSLVSRQTSTGQIIGTLAYMSPEQAEGRSEEVDTRSDIYSLGVMLYELIAGRLPYDLGRMTPHAAAREIVEKAPSRLSRVDRSLRGDVETIVSKAMEKDRDRRYASAGDLAADLRRYLADQPILARPPSAVYQLRKFTRRNKTLVGGVAATVLALLTGLLLVQRSERAAQQIEQRALADSLAQTADFAAGRGDWKTALDASDKALLAGHPDAIQMRLAKIEAWHALNDVHAANAELNAVWEAPHAAEHRGTILMWEAELALSRWKEDTAKSKLQAALKETDLSGADREYIEAMLSKSMAETTRHLRAAVKNAPFHHRAHGLLAVTLFLSGETDSVAEELRLSQRIFPNDAGFVLLEAICHALEGDRAKTAVTLDRLGEQFGVEASAQWRRAVEATVDMVAQTAAAPISAQPPLTPDKVFAIIVAYGEATTGAPLPAPTPQPNMTLSSSILNVRLPHSSAISSGFGELSTAFQRAAMGMRGQAVDVITRAIRINPIAPLYLMRAMVRPESQVKERIRDLRRADRAPTPIPAIRKVCLGELIISELELLGLPQPGDKPPFGFQRNPKLAEECRGDILRLVREHDLKPLDNAQFGMCAVVTGDVSLGQFLIDEAKRQAPQDPDVNHYCSSAEMAMKTLRDGNAANLPAQTSASNR